MNLNLASPTINWKTTKLPTDLTKDHQIEQQLYCHPYQGKDPQYLVVNVVHLNQNDNLVHVGYFLNPDQLEANKRAIAILNYQKWIGLLLIIKPLQRWMQEVHRFIKQTYLKQSIGFEQIIIKLIGDQNRHSQLAITIGKNEYRFQISDLFLNQAADCDHLKIDEQMLFNWIHLQIYEQLVATNPYDQKAINYDFRHDLTLNRPPKATKRFWTK